MYETLSLSRPLIDANTRLGSCRFEVIYDGSKSFWQGCSPLEKREEPHEPFVEGRAETCAMTKSPQIAPLPNGV